MSQCGHNTLCSLSAEGFESKHCLVVITEKKDTLTVLLVWAHVPVPPLRFSKVLAVWPKVLAKS